MVRIAGYIRPNAEQQDRWADEQHALPLLTGPALEQGREEEHQAEDRREEGDREEHQEELASNALGAQERLGDCPGDAHEDVRRHGLTSGEVGERENRGGAEGIRPTPVRVTWGQVRVSWVSSSATSSRCSRASPCRPGR